MSDTPEDDPSQEPERKATSREPAQNLFGHKGGARPWDGMERRESAGSAPSGAHDPSRMTSSAPYPENAAYAPRAETAPSAGRAPHITIVDEGDDLTKLHPNYKLVMRIAALFLGVVILIVGIVVDGALQAEGAPVPFGTVSIPALLIALFIIIRIPAARYNARGYQFGTDRLRVVRGILWHSDTVVPFGRVQHIDVEQGPIERGLGIATMTLHTAGSHNASVKLPGLGHDLATTMREDIRAHIKRESL
jgi:membrane protein YdbS with pleckstrin-like domain